MNGIGHAIPLGKRPKLAELAAKRGIRLESNPRSNLYCGFIKDIKNLKLDTLLGLGVKVTINPDDPSMWPAGHLADNLALVANSYGTDVVNQCIKNSIETAWELTPEEKTILIKNLQ